MERLLEKFYDAYILELRCGQRLQVCLKYLNSSMIIILQLPGGSVKWEGKIILDQSVGGFQPLEPSESCTFSQEKWTGSQSSMDNFWEDSFFLKSVKVPKWRVPHLDSLFSLQFGSLTREVNKILYEI